MGRYGLSQIEPSHILFNHHKKNVNLATLKNVVFIIQFLQEFHTEIILSNRQCFHYKCTILRIQLN